MTPFSTDAKFPMRVVLYQVKVQMFTFFLPSTTDRSENINRYLRSVNLLPTDIAESSFETEDAISFDPAQLDTLYPEKNVMTETVVKMLKK